MMRSFLPVLLLALLSVVTGSHAAVPLADDHGPVAIPPPLAAYEAQEAEQGITGLWNILSYRVAQNPFNLIATIVFFLAIFHTFAAGYFRKKAHHLEHEYHERIRRENRTAIAKGYEGAKDDSSFWASILHFFGEVEAIFGIWLIPLMAAIFFTFDWETVTGYFDNVHYTEPMFVVVIMAISSTRPVLKFAERVLGLIAGLGGRTPTAWWISILIIAPLLGSFITEPAAMTIAALLLARQFYRLNPPDKLKYATIGLLFVNVSVGGTLTHFAAPPVLMVAGKWGWDTPYMFLHFGDKAVLGICLATALYYFLFRKDFAALNEQAARNAAVQGRTRDDEPVPFWITGVVLLFMTWTVLTLHHPALFLGGFLFFLAFVQATDTHQDEVSVRGPLLVGFFLAALVTHGQLQQWWIAPVLSSLGELPLFLGATVLTAFNDNAAITYLASLVPAFDHNLYPETAPAFQYAVVAGAVTGGGLTVIANAPNPAGQSILQRFFTNGVSPLWLAAYALVPTIIMALCFLLL